MFSASKSTKATRLIDDFRISFESKKFTRALDGVSVSIRGDLQMVAVSSESAIQPASMMAAYDQCLHVVKYARSIAMVQIRNQLLKDRMDVTNLIPEVQEALDYLDKHPRPADLAAD